jgi:hypothetical protein
LSVLALSYPAGLSDNQEALMEGDKMPRHVLAAGVLFAWLFVTLGARPAPAQTGPGSAPSPAASNANQSALRDGAHDFDFNIGRWTTHISRLLHPLSGSTTWVHLTGTVDIHKVWGGKAQIEQIEADGPSGRFEGLTLFLYNPAARQWSLSFASSSDGAFEQPAVGEFQDGRGEFYDQEPYNGRDILVRVVWSDITPNSHKFEQSFSDDGGKTWEPNFVAELTRLEENAALNEPKPVSADPGQHAFDWDTGTWQSQHRRLLHPLTGSTTWVDYRGTDVVHKIWGGRGSYGEIEADGAAGHLELLGVRLYDPTNHLWNIYFANSATGTLSVPSVGGFKDGRADFYDAETLNGRPILVRFSVSDMTADSARFEQAFSADWGRTWEVNLIVPETRAKDLAKRGQ